MQIELEALEKNQTWTLTALPANKKPIDCKWIYRVKYLPDGSVEKYKVRLVAKGFTQMLGLDYLDTYSPVAKLVTVRLLLAVCISFNWHMHQLDVNNAYLHGDLDEDIYIVPPKGYTKALPGQFCKLQKSLYGPKQAGRQWNKMFTQTITDFGFQQSARDSCLFTKGSADNFVALLVYVDDVLFIGPNDVLLSEVKTFLDKSFTIKDLGIAKYFLGIELARSSTGLFISQQKFIRGMLEEAGLTDTKPVCTPLIQGLNLVPDMGAKLEQLEQYRRLVGRLLYPSLTRPDITHGVQQLTQYMQEPCQGHFKAAIHLLKYLNGTYSRGIFFPASNTMQLQAYSDADWATFSATRKSITGYCIFLGKSLVSWKTKKQATSSAEAECIGLASTVCELQWITYILNDLQVPVQPIPLLCDNQATLHMAANSVFHEMTKHLDIDCHIVKNQLKAGFIDTKNAACSWGWLISHHHQLEGGY